MKIDVRNIEYNALQEISDIVSELYDYTGDEKVTDNIRLAKLGEIRGICRFADIMKGVLNS